MRRITVALFIMMMLVGAVAVSASSLDEVKKKAVTNQMCPVMNAAVSEKYRSEYKNQYVYFCCQGCVKIFDKDPETYIAKLSKQDREAVKANEICPVTDDPITDHTRFTEHEGRKVYFCCDGCSDMFKKKLAEKKTE